MDDGKVTFVGSQEGRVRSQRLRRRNGRRESGDLRWGGHRP